MMDTSLDKLTTLITFENKEEREQLIKAYDFAKKVHDGQVRNSGEPYFNHLFATAVNLAELGMSTTSIIAGLLHDSVEDMNIPPETIEKEFGKDIRFIVEGVTKLGKLRYHGSDRYNESLRKLFVAMSEDIRVLLVKLCDRLHNIETLEFVPKEKQERIARETLEIYAPIAYRLGIRKLSKRLEDLSFPYVYPKEFREIKDLVEEREEKQMQTLEKFREVVIKELEKNNIKNFTTDYRVKGIYSLYKKYIKNNKDIDKIYDILAMRILLKNQDDCYRVLGIIHSFSQPLPGRIKDYIAFPKQNGYQALHTTVFTGDGSIVEVQIKTEEMNEESEFGIASHISYKSGNKKSKSNQGLDWIKKILPSYISKYHPNKDDGENHKDVPEWVKDLVSYQSSINNKEEALEDIKGDFFNERIFVFTPKGDVLDLPINSSAIDFAYSIHSDVGNHMAGVKINSKMVSFDTKLKNGDIVEIITKKSAKPNRKWLEHAKTTIAKKHIRNQ